MRACLFLFVFSLWPLFASAQERPVIEYPTLTPPALLVGSASTHQPPDDSFLYRQRAKKWLYISGATLTLGAATLATGVRLFNKGKNAKKIAVGDVLINVGFGVSFATLLPLGVSGYWFKKSRQH